MEMVPSSPRRERERERERESVGGEKSLLFLGEPHFLFFQDSPEGMVASVVVMVVDMVVATEVSLFFPALLVPFPPFSFLLFFVSHLCSNIVSFSGYGGFSGTCFFIMFVCLFAIFRLFCFHLSLC